MPKVYLVSVRWVATTMNAELIDSVLGLHGDWLRFNAQTWFVATNNDPNTLQQAVMSRLSEQDSVVVMEIAATAYNGWAPKWIWDWFATRLGPPSG